MSCPSCAADNVPLAVVDGITEYRCRDCGLVFYGPCGCVTADAAGAVAAQQAAEAQAERLGDWQMATPKADIDQPAGVRRFTGCP